MTTSSVGVVGGGILGLAVARTLLAEHGSEVTVLEKETKFAQHQSGRNSGVVHAGIYYEPGSLKARLCRRGMFLLRSFCEKRLVPYEEYGKTIVALDEAERSRLDVLKDRAARNGVLGVRLVWPADIHEMEPHAAGIAALHSPTTAIVDYEAVCPELARDIEQLGREVRIDAAVTSIDRSRPRVQAVAGGETLEFDTLVVCAGLHSNRVARLAGDVPDPEIVPFKGEYYRLRPSSTGLVRGLVYPVPDSRYPFLGVHVTRRVDGGAHVGPNAVLALAPEGYGRLAVRPQDVVDLVHSRGFRTIARTHWRTGAREVVALLSKRAFAARATVRSPRSRPAISIRAPPGIRAQAVDPDGSLVDDFRINQVGSIVAVRNAPSPGATSSLAIAEHLCRPHP